MGSVHLAPELTTSALNTAHPHIHRHDVRGGAAAVGGPRREGGSGRAPHQAGAAPPLGGVAGAWVDVGGWVDGCAVSSDFRALFIVRKSHQYNIPNPDNTVPKARVHQFRPWPNAAEAATKGEVKAGAGEEQKEEPRGGGSSR